MLGQQDDPRGTVLPLDSGPDAAEPPAPERTVRLRPSRPGFPPGPALLLSRRPAGPAAPDSGRPWGEPLSGSSELARGLTRHGERGPEPGVTFRLALPEGFGAEPLLCLTGAEPAGGAGGPSALLSVGPGGPLPAPGVGLGLLTLTTAVEISAIGTQRRVLEELSGAAAEFAPDSVLRLDARLRAAEESLRAAQTELLEHGAIGTGSGLDTAAANLSVLRHQTHAWISGWERVVAGADRRGMPGAALRESLGEVGRLGWAGFPGAVHSAYQALVLDARRLLISASDHLMRSPGRGMPALRGLVEGDLAGRAADVARLHRLLTSLSTLPLTVRKRSGAMLPNLIADQATTNARTQVLFTLMANALRPPAAPGPVTLEVRSLDDGELQVLGSVQQ
ncbi:hypothetical protein WIS52_29665 [Pseudonocardia nematodicida]|uniref:Uncharacterized protein n=1 Tax=Pseudonocardia nematodicida TaxID=1206997 RepID=A0ABV1KL38_9PSEU